MKKFILIVVILFISNCAFAISPKVDTTVRVAINKYKFGNYAGCIQDLDQYVKKKPTALAYYYLGMAYTQAGMTEKASTSYSKAINNAKKEKNTVIQKYAEIGKLKVESPEKFYDKKSYDEINTLLKDRKKIPEDLQNDLRKKHLEYLRNEMNSSKNPTF